MGQDGPFGEFVLGRPAALGLYSCPMEFERQQKAMVQEVEAAIGTLLPPADAPSSRLHAAMRYSMGAGGKRVRPVMVLAAARLRGSPAADPLPAAVAVECVHTYSLIHDDLPCMDNDDLRRGRPTAHKAFDEATALLAGDALLAQAFVLLGTSYAAHPALALGLVRELSGAASSTRLVGGQMEDLLAEGRAATTEEQLRYIHLNKTAAMIEASLAMGGVCGGADPATLDALRGAGRLLGLAFQVVDDILDATADTATLGKTAGKDARSGKATYVSLHGLDGARSIASTLSRDAVAAFRALPGDPSFLAALAEHLLKRER
jgi:geranylgeranyl diphosphate synthase, type II